MDYDSLCNALKALLAQDDPRMTTLANAASLLYETLPDINWAGFYLFEKGALRLGPFCGRPACTEIAPGKGVCGKAYDERRTLIVKNVHEFPGHIACDSASNSEIVLPLYARSGALIGVMDIDSTLFSRFSEEDGAGLERAAKVISDALGEDMRPIRPGAKALIIRDGALLVTKNRESDTGEEFYGLPGGGQHKFETLTDTLKRECKEELGIDITVGRLAFVRDYIGANHKFAYKHEGVHHINFYFSCELAGEVHMERATEVDAMQFGYEWLPIAQLKDANFYPAELKAHILPDGTLLGDVYLGDVN